MGPKIDLKRLGDQLVVRHQQMGAGQDNCHGSRLYTEKILFSSEKQHKKSFPSGTNIYKTLNWKHIEETFLLGFHDT